MSEDAEVTISYLILCHDSPDRIVRLATRILSEDKTGQVVIHFDKNSSVKIFNELKDKLRNVSRCHVLTKRIRCGWGKWGLVQASIEMLQFSILNNLSDYYYLLSEYCFPNKSLINLKEYLTRNRGQIYIECEDEQWIRSGIKHDRYMYWFFFYKRKMPLLHRFSYRLQKYLKIHKQKDSDLNIRFGSQWWCIDVDAVKYILKYEYKYRRFFKTSWIPDEMFFQSLLWRYNKDKLISKSLTYSKFDDDGKPMVFNHSSIIDGSYFFYRKVL